MRFAKLALAALAVLVLAAAGGAFGVVYLAPEEAVRLGLEAGRLRAGLARKEIALADGLRFVYLEGGTGEPLLLLHGFGASKDSFTRVARFLTPRYRVIVPDLIGFGESARPAGADYAPRAQAQRLHALAKVLGIGHLHLGGNSMGGHIALTYAALYPDEVGSLWLLDTGGIWSGPPSEVRRIIEQTGRNPLMVGTEEGFARLLAIVMADPPYVPGPIIGVLAQPRIRNFALEERIFWQLAADSLEERVNGLETPALIVWGDRDRVIDAGTAWVLHKLMPRSKVVIMPGIGHVPMIERPERSAEDYLRFRTAMQRG